MKKRTAVERLARELKEISGWNPWDKTDIDAIARHVLRRERRARGRTVGWARYWSGSGDILETTERRRPTSNARVVLVPRVRR